MAKLRLYMRDLTTSNCDRKQDECRSTGISRTFETRVFAAYKMSDANKSNFAIPVAVIVFITEGCTHFG